MAIAFWGKNRHHEWWKLKRRHLLQTAADCGLAFGEEALDGLLEAVPDAIEAARSELPRAFPVSVAQPIFDGVTQTAKRLAKK